MYSAWRNQIISEQIYSRLALVGGGRTPQGNYLFFFSFFNFRFSFGLCRAFFCSSLLPLSFFPLSAISLSPMLIYPNSIALLLQSTTRRSGFFILGIDSDTSLGFNGLICLIIPPITNLHDTLLSYCLKPSFSSYSSLRIISNFRWTRNLSSAVILP